MYTQVGHLLNYAVCVKKIQSNIRLYIELMQNTVPRPWQGPCRAPYKLFAAQYNAIKKVRREIKLTIIEETLKGRFSLNTM